MRNYKVRISHSAYEDMAVLRKFLIEMMTEEGAIRYANAMRSKVKGCDSEREGNKCDD